MTSLSKVIKSSHAELNHRTNRRIEIQQIDQTIVTDHLLSDEERIEYREKRSLEILHSAERQAKQWKEKMEEERLAHEAYLERSREELLIKIEEETERARQEGYRAGYEIGRKEGYESYQSLLEQVKKMAEAAKRDYMAKLEEAEPAIVRLAVKMAKKLVKDTLRENPDSWTNIVKDLIKEARENDEIKLYVHPDWYEFTIMHRQELQNLLLETTDFYIYPDETLPEYGCMLEYPFGKIEAGLDSQFTELKKKMMEYLEVLVNESTGAAVEN